MYISELDLHGFKSFAHKTTIKFDSGITAIVGPNGCGKSNVVDALRWVLGEQRPTLLRSASMNNVIFNGTSRRKKLGMAEVSLTFINNKGVLPTEYSEVTITRRLYRSGESEYLMNQTTCRLKDIMELFMDTGMGADAYSVIELKMVEEILNDRNNDRRRLFEEAAGITRYKEKRKKTFRKLDETLKDLQRIDDLLIEVRKKARSLQLQAERAERARTIRIELEQLDKAWNRREYLKIESELEPLRKQIASAEKERSEIGDLLEEKEQKEQQSREEMISREQHLAEMRKSAGNIESSIREMETRIRITSEKVSNEESLIGRYKEDIRQAEEDLDEMKRVRKGNITRFESISSELEKSESSLKESRERFSEVQQQFTKERHELYELEISTSDASGKVDELRAARIKLESRIENTEGDLNRIDREIEELRQKVEILERSITETEETLRTRSEELESEEERLENALEKRKELEGQRESYRDVMRSGQSRIESLMSETVLMKELAESRDMLPSSVAYLMEHHGGSFNTLDVVSNIIQTDEEHAPALEAALGEAIHYMITDNMEEALRAASILKKKEQGRATFIPLDELKSHYESEKHSILSVVEVEPKFKAVAELLLGSVLLSEDVNQARRLLQAGGSAAVTGDGDLVTSNRFYRSGSLSQQAGVRLGLKDKLEKLESAHIRVAGELENKSRKLKKTEEALKSLDTEALRRSVREREKSVQSIRQQLGQMKSEAGVYRKSVEDLALRKSSVLTSEDSARSELENLSPKQKELTSRIEALEKSQNEHKERLKVLEEERSIAQNRFNDAQLTHQDLKNKAQNLEREIGRADSGIESLEKRHATRQELIDEARRRIREYEQLLAETTRELERAKLQKEATNEKQAGAEEACSLQRGVINELETSLKELRRRKEVNLELVHHLTMAREKFELQAQNLADHVWETYGILMKQIEETIPDEMEPEAVRERITRLRQQLSQIGEVNPLAIEEYDEEKERLDFLEEQTGDLREAEEQLRETIQEINEKATVRFNETFEQIRKNFISVFHTLFESDDYCDLIIEQDLEDPLEAKIEIKANPKGKRPSGINQLSGGEKTLTAIALLFAIYLVKPSPFCILDEVDAPLDDANIERFANMIRQFSTETQFIIITHNKKTMSKAEMMYGITMPETGVSRLVGVKLDEIEEAAG
ncbi:MAG: chromosome segregation protein SMC [Balneolaceae bacterium]